MADFHRMQARLPSGQWVTEVIPAGNIPDAKATMAARWPTAKTIQWSGTSPDPKYQEQVAAFRADTERKTQEYYKNAHGHVPGGREIPNCPTDDNYQPTNNTVGGDTDGGSGCGTLLVLGLISLVAVTGMFGGGSTETPTVTPEAPVVEVPAPVFDRDVAIERNNFYVENGINQRNCSRYLTTTECGGQYSPEVFGLW